MESAVSTVVEANGLPHLKISVQEEAPQEGIMELLKSLRPQWRTGDVKMKASALHPQYICTEHTVCS